MKHRVLLATLLLASLLMVACGGDNSPTTPPRQISEIAMPSLTAFDLGTADSQAGKYYLADPGNNAVDVFSTQTDALTGSLASAAFAGDHSVNFDFSRSGPNGLVAIAGTSKIYVGDVNSVKIVDSQSGAVTKNIVLSSSGLRVDEGCYDADDAIVMFSSPNESPPFVSFISTSTQTLIARYTFSTDTTGVEQCAYDPHSKSFLINNDGTSANPDGEVDVLTAASVLANSPKVSKSFPLTGCNPGGLALGPDNEMVIGCGQQITLILDRSSGSVSATFPFGGADQVAYDSVTNRYFIPAFGAASPTLDVIDAQSKTLIKQLPIGNGAHSIAIDGANHKVYVPHAPGAPGTPFATSGVTVFSTD